MHKVTHQTLQLKMTNGSKKEKANTDHVSTTITLNVGMINRNFTVRGLAIK
jgi:hypothetical protein